MSKTNTPAVSAHLATVSAIMAIGTNKAEAVKFGAQLASAIATLFAECNGSDADFVAEFGNGENSKSKTYKAGALADDIRAEVKSIKDEARKTSILNTLKSRLSEARALRKLGGMPQPDENLQAAVKRYKTPKVEAEKPAAAPAAPTVITLETFAKEASIGEIADLVSRWVAHHGNADRGLATVLADSLPITVKPNRKAV